MNYFVVWFLFILRAWNFNLIQTKRNLDLNTFKLRLLLETETYTPESLILSILVSSETIFHFLEYIILELFRVFL